MNLKNEIELNRNRNTTVEKRRGKEKRAKSI